MLNLSNPDIKSTNFKLSRSLKYNLKLLARNKATAHLIRINKLEKGELLVEENKPVKGIYFILEGKVKILNTEINKTTKIFRLASKGDLVGFSSLNASKYWSSAIAIGSVEAYFISSKSLKLIFKKNSKLNLLFLNALVLKLQNYEMRQRYLNIFPATDRIIEAILLIASKFGETTNDGIEISDCASRKEIASLANTSTENTVRVISRLKADKHVVTEGRKIIIKNKEALINKLKEHCCSKEIISDMYTCYLDLFYE
jgi:CRP/FNR family transcriptional regulator, anaerobic regulatory protein